MISLAYGGDPNQVGDLRLPTGEGPYPVAVLLHGGFWRERYRRGIMDRLAADLTARGWAPGTSSTGEWARAAAAGRRHWTTSPPASTLVDQPVDLEHVAVIGHSAGGHLALWAAARQRPP